MVTYIMSNSPGYLKEGGAKNGSILQISKQRLRDVKSLTCSYSAPSSLAQVGLILKSGTEK